MFTCKWRNFKITSLNEVETLNTKNTTHAKIQILALTIRHHSSRFFILPYSVYKFFTCTDPLSLANVI